MKKKEEKEEEEEGGELVLAGKSFKLPSSCLSTYIMSPFWGKNLEQSFHTC